MSQKDVVAEPVRDPVTDPLLTPENCAVVLIDYQDTQFDSVNSTTRDNILLNVTALARFVTNFDVPVIVSTVAVEMGVNGPTVRDIMDELPKGTAELDRSGVNAWENPDFRAAVERLGRKKIVIGGLWTEVCVAFPTLDLLRAGYEVYPVADAIGGVTQTAHDTAMDRMRAAGAQPVTALQFGAELMRDWARGDNGDRFREVMNWYLEKRTKLAKSGKLGDEG